MTLTKTQIQNLLGVSRAWANKRVEKHTPTHSELVAMVREWNSKTGIRGHEPHPPHRVRDRWARLVLLDG